MDRRLLAWARAVKRRRAATRNALPALWLFADSQRTPDLLATIGGLPRAAGVVFRPEGWPEAAKLGLAVAQLCRRRRLVLTVAGDTRLAWRLHAGVHLRGGRRAGSGRLPKGPITSSAHSIQEMRRARRAGAALLFLSPAFPTRSHPGLQALGPARWTALARKFGGPLVCALGGVTGENARRLGRSACFGAGAIDALVTTPVVRRPQCFAIAIQQPLTRLRDKLSDEHSPPRQRLGTRLERCARTPQGGKGQ